jgi:hypothetical protein
MTIEPAITGERPTAPQWQAPTRLLQASRLGTILHGVRAHALVLAAALWLGAGSAHAVHLNSAGLGQVLLFPYYTVRGLGNSPDDHFETLLAVTNSTSRTKVVKVRLLEGKAGAETLSFNLFLGPFDAWSGVVTRTDHGAAVISDDLSCTVPTQLFTKRRDVTLTDPNHLTARHYRDRGDGAGVTLDRTREGYAEIIEMGEVTRADILAALTRVDGKPHDCETVSAFDGYLSPWLSPPTGGLSGRVNIVNATFGIGFGHDAVALDDWSATEQYTASDSLLPTLAGGGGAAQSPANTHSTVIANGAVYRSDWGTGLSAASDAVSAVLMKWFVMGEFDVSTATDASTDWIVTYPTMRNYVQTGKGAARRPFASNFDSTGMACAPSGGAPNVFDFTAYNREGQTGFNRVVIASHQPIRQTITCYVTNRIAFESALFDSRLTHRLLTDELLPQRAVSREADSITRYLLRANHTPILPDNRAGNYSMNFNAAVQIMYPVRTTHGGRVIQVGYRGIPAIGIQFKDFVTVPSPDGRNPRYGASGLLRYSQQVLVF